MKKICKQCGKEYDTSKSRSKYCSSKCVGDSQSKDLTGKRFGKLLVIECVGKREKVGGLLWKCKCDCGNEVILSSCSFSANKSGVTSCGCMTDELRARTKTPYGQTTFRIVLGTYKFSAKNRNLSFELTEDEFRELTQQNCVYCGSEPSNISRSSKNNGDFIYNGIDRVDSSKGYSIDNCVPCCKICNAMKLDHTTDFFMKHISRIYHNRKT